MPTPVLSAVYHKYAFDVHNPTGAGLPEAVTAPPPTKPLPQKQLQPTAPIKAPPTAAQLHNNNAAGQPATMSLTRPDNSTALQPAITVSPPAGSPAAAPASPQSDVKTTPTTESPTSTIVSGQSAPQGAPPPAANTEADVTKPIDINAITAQITDQNIPVEQRQKFAEDFVAQHVKQNPFLLKGFQDIQAGNKDTEAAQAYTARLQQSQDEFIKQQIAANPDKASTPQGFGEVVNGAISQFQNMPMPMQAMVGIGVPLALVGGISSLFGNGGMGMGILSLLGLGAAGVGAAAGGMLGDGAAGMVGDAMYSLGNFAGMVPEKADLSILKSEDPIQAIIQGDGKGYDGWIGPKVKTVQKQLEAGRKQIEDLRKLMSLPIADAAKAHLLRRLDPSLDSVEAGQHALANAGKILTALDDPESALSQHIQRGDRYVQKPYTVIGEEVGSRAGKAIESAKDSIMSMLPELPAASMPSFQIPTLSLGRETRASANMDIKTLIDRWSNAEKAAALTAKIARCWAGYEPVPGAKAYSKGSCRPKGSKKTQKEMKKS